MGDTFHKTLSVIFRLLLVRFAWDLKQIPLISYKKTCPSHKTFRQRSGLKVINEQTHFILVMRLHSTEMMQESVLYFLCLCV